MLYLKIVLLQASVLGDLKAERGGESMWDNPIGFIIGAVLVFYLIYRYGKDD